MADSDSPQEAGPIVFGYDGSELANLAIEKAGRVLAGTRDALVVCVWQPFDVGFLPQDGNELTANDPARVHQAAERTAQEGARRAAAAGFRAQALAVESSPTWKGIIDTADEHDACLIVLGSHSRNRLAGALVGSVASAVTHHSRRSVLITHA